MKRPIKWHIECLTNRELYLQEEQKRLHMIRESYEFAKFQLACAIDEGRDGYDPERYKVKMGGKR